MGEGARACLTHGLTQQRRARPRAEPPRDRVRTAHHPASTAQLKPHRTRLEDRNVQDGGITPSCGQARPSEAIVFGDLHDKTSRVAALAQGPRGYRALEGLNTRPAITYLARVVHGAVVED